ncbi:MAG TPA: patatin-like phospholipase family protein [Candidatus Melainabacteria bacterium]|nr:patatin-like phospholipase family protein [Candidatus Melainabacteria bacterium]
MTKSVELVFGAGGVKGYFHIGLLKAVEELGIEVSKVTGVSVGAIIASFYTNGMTADQILKLFLEAHEKSGNPLLLASAVTVPDMKSFLVGMSFLSLEKPWEETVERLGLTPNERLRILACDARSKKSVLFQGTDYKLHTALSASGALPGVFLPVLLDDKLLIDGAAYHRNPDEFCETTAIISALGFAKRLSLELQDPISAYFQWREVYLPVVHQPTKVDKERHIVVEHQADDICGLAFNLSPKRCMWMYEQGYQHGMQVLRQAIADGKLESDIESTAPAN